MPAHTVGCKVHVEILPFPLPAPSPRSFKVYKGSDVKGKPNNTGAAMKKRKDAKQW